MRVLVSDRQAAEQSRVKGCSPVACNKVRVNKINHTCQRPIKIHKHDICRDERYTYNAYRRNSLCCDWLLLPSSLFSPLSTHHGLESRLDALDRAAGTTRLTLEEEQPRLLLQESVRRTTCVAGNILLCGGEEMASILIPTHYNNCVYTMYIQHAYRFQTI